MMRSMFSAISGLKTHQIKMDVTANDISNVNTIGYKAARTTFRDSLSQLQRGGSAGSNAAQIGLGVTLGSIDNQMSAGATQTTGAPLDLAISGEGFFRVKTDPASADVEYTNPAGQIVTQEGQFVVDPTGAPIVLPPGATGISVGQSGNVTYVPAAGGARATAGTVSLATFPNASGLERVPGNRWREGSNSGAPTVGAPGAANNGTIIAGAIEMSNVDLSTTFTDMIIAERGYQANSRVISTSDEMLQDLVNLKR